MYLMKRSIENCLIYLRGLQSIYLELCTGYTALVPGTYKSILLAHAFVHDQNCLAGMQYNVCVFYMTAKYNCTPSTNVCSVQLCWIHQIHGSTIMDPRSSKHGCKVYAYENIKAHVQGIRTDDTTCIASTVNGEKLHWYTFSNVAFELVVNNCSGPRSSFSLLHSTTQLQNPNPLC
jgi:hypothetical protein